jgi:DNA-directed RNA polymerase beta' subunit
MINDKLNLDSLSETYEVLEIGSIEFGLMSQDDILNQSVAEITSNRLFTSSFAQNGGFQSKTDNMDIGTVYDSRMGPLKNEKCITCSKGFQECAGHFGHINLNVSIIHPLYYRTVLSFLKTVCIQCSRLLVTQDHLSLWNLMKLKGEARFNQILIHIIKIRFCLHCNISQPKYTISDGTFIASYKLQGSQVEKIKITMSEISKIFSNVSDDDVRLLGFDPSRSHPNFLILSVLPVIPPCSRPFIMSDNVICDDDLTIAYCEIIKANNNLAKATTETKRQKYIQTLIFRIKTLMDNSQGKAKHTNSRQMKGIKERLCGKDALIRNNLMGKRVNFSARTVIGPDPTLRLNEIAIPYEIAENLTYPENVNDYNIEKLQRLVWEGKINIIERNYNGKIQRIHTKFALKCDTKYILCKLEIGDIAHCQLMDGDPVFLNRQPTLHKGSMLAKKIIRRHGKTIRMNLATTSSFNADFDGDEMNIHTASSEMSKAELILLSSTETNIIGASGSCPIICIVQDSLLGCYLMTKNNDEISREDFFQLCMKCDGWDFQLIQHKFNMAEQVYEKFNKNIPLYSGRTLFSMLLPDDFMYNVKNNALEEEPIVKIYKGILYEGAINKANIKTSHQSIILLLHKEYSPEICLNFINNVQFVANEFMTYHGFSIGISDCVRNSKSSNAIDEVVTKCFIEAEELENSTNNNFIKEAKINMVLSKAKDIGMRIAKESFSVNNNFISTVTSGSKGDFFNIAQITGLLGQQNINGIRIPAKLNNSKRTLSAYPININKITEYESKGFIKNSFIKGLNPLEYWFHASSARVCLVDTAMKTANSGYVQRKMVKVMEDLSVKYDQTVRNSMGSIISFSHGGNNLDPTQSVLINSNINKTNINTINTDKTNFVCDVERIIDKFNSRYELENNII